MGSAPSLDAETGEAKKILADFSAAFMKNYGMMYAVGVCKEIQEEALKPERRQKLLKCEASAPAPVRKKGMLKKESVHLKKFNDRFVVVRGDWIIDYYDSEADFEKKPEKPRGTINLSGYYIVRDLNNTLLHRITKIAEKVGLPVADLPKPKTYPDFTFEVYHSRRAPMHFQCANAEEFKAWCDVFDDARWWAPNLSITDDSVHKKVFSEALWRTRWQTGMWGWWYGGGGEVAYLSDCITEKIEDDVMAKVDAKLTMPWALRSKIRDTFMKTVGETVKGGVTPAWNAAYAAAKKSRPALEEAVKPAMEKIAQVQKDIQTKIITEVDALTSKALREDLGPKLAPLADEVFGPLQESFKLLLIAFDKAIDAAKGKDVKDPKGLYMVKHYSWSWDYWAAERKVWALYDPLSQMSKVFSDVEPWNCTRRVYRRLRKTFDDALFTFESLLQEGKSWEEAHQETRTRMVHDCKLGVMICVGRVLESVVQGPWSKLVVQPANKVIEPLASMVPEPVQQFVDIQDILASTLKQILRQGCENVFHGYAERISLE